MKNIAGLRCLTAFVLTLAVFLSSSMVVLASTGENRIKGEIIFLGNDGDSEKPAVTLDGQRVLSGFTFFSSGEISTSETKSATVNPGKLGAVNLSPNSKLSLSFTENSISGNLLNGEIKVFSKEGVAVNIQTPDGVINNDASQPGVFAIDVRSGSTKTAPEQGSVFLNNGQTNIPQQGGQQQSSGGGNSIWVPVLVLSGIVAAVIIIVVATNDDDDDVVSPVR